MVCFVYTYKPNTQRQIFYEAKSSKREKKKEIEKEKRKPLNSLNIRCPPATSTVGVESIVQNPHSGG